MQKKQISSIGILLLLLLLFSSIRSEAQLVIQPVPFGAGGSSGPINCTSNGTALLPCYTGSTVNSGIYFSGTSTLISSNGTQAFSLVAGGVITIPIAGRYGFDGVSNGMLLSGTATAIVPSDGGAYFKVGLGSVQVNSAGLAFQNGGTNIFQIPASTVDGKINFTNGAGSIGIGIDVTADSLLKIRTRAQTGDAAVSASFYSSSTVSALVVTTNTIAPTSTIHSLGAGLIKTITVPATCTPTCTLQIVPTAAYTYDATGNINVPVGGGLALISKLMTFVWDGTKWTPSY